MLPDIIFTIKILFLDKSLAKASRTDGRTDRRTERRRDGRPILWRCEDASETDNSETDGETGDAPSHQDARTHRKTNSKNKTV